MTRPTISPKRAILAYGEQQRIRTQRDPEKHARYREWLHRELQMLPAEFERLQGARISVATGEAAKQFAVRCINVARSLQEPDHCGVVLLAARALQIQSQSLEARDYHEDAKRVIGKARVLLSFLARSPDTTPTVRKISAEVLSSLN